VPKIDISVFANNDPTFAFNLYDKRGRIRTATDLTGATVECYVKANATTKDVDADAMYTGYVPAPTTGQVIVSMSSTAVGGDARQFYHLDVVRNGRRQTYAWGVIKKLGFA
jgi:hypothetical protein